MAGETVKAEAVCLRIVPWSRTSHIVQWLTPTGKVIMRPCRKSIVQEQRKLKKFKRFLAPGEMKIEDVRTSYESWRGGKTHMDGYKSIRSMDKRYTDQFGLIPAAIKKKNRRRNKCSGM